MYKAQFKWTDELVLEFTKLSTMGSYGIFEDTRNIEDKLDKFKLVTEQRKRELKKKRVLVGSRGMNEDGSRFYFDSRGIKWNIKRVALPNDNSYTAESELNEAFRTTFLSDVYLQIENQASKQIEVKKNLEEILK